MESINSKNPENEILNKRFSVKWDDNSMTSFTEDFTFTEYIRKEFNIIAEAIGTPKTARKQNKTLFKPFILNKFETFYLFEIQIIQFDKIEHDFQVRECFERFKDKIEYIVYKHLKEKKLFVTSGIKYGADFLLYRDDPNFIHSEFLVYIKDYKNDISIKEIISGERISLSHKKKFLVASVGEDKKIKFFNMEWLNI